MLNIRRRLQRMGKCCRGDNKLCEKDSKVYVRNFQLDQMYQWKDIYYFAMVAGLNRFHNGHSVTALWLQEGSVREILTQGGHSRNLFNVTDLPEMGELDLLGLGVEGHRRAVSHHHINISDDNITLLCR